MASFQPFNLGRHQCIGLKLAFAELRIVVARVVWAFVFEGTEGKVWDWGELRSFITWEKRGIEVEVGRAEVR